MDGFGYTKTNVLDAHKRALDKNYQRKNAEQRARQFQDVRRQTRHGLLLKKRNINSENDSPFVTPVADQPKATRSKYQSNQKKERVVADKRNERLAKWKEEKARRKLEEKKNAKPAFRLFCKVPVELGLPKLDNVNKEIKGKPIKPIYKSVFAPKNHVFQAPRNLKAADLKTVTPANKENQSSVRKTTRIPVRGTRTEARATTKYSQSNTPKQPTIHKNVWILKPVKSTGKSKQSRGSNYGLDENISSTNGSISVHSEDSKESSTRSTKSGKRKTVQIDEEPIVIEDSVIEIDSRMDGSDRETIYSDEEISIRTPLRKSHLNALRISTPYPKMQNISLDGEDGVSNGGDERRSLRGSMKPLTVTETEDTTGNNSLSTKHVPESMGDLSPKNVVAKDDSAVVSAKKNNRRSRRATNSKRPSSDYKTAAGSVYVTEMANEKIEDAVNNKSLSKKSVTFLPDLSHGPSSISIHLESDLASAKKNKRRSRSILASKRFSLSTSSSIEAGEYFTKVLDDEIARIEGICELWEDYKTQNDLTEDVENMINAAIGLSKLLIAKKFPQFRELIEECRSSVFKEKPVTSHDLQGYWETAYLQVEDLDKKFAHLEKLKTNRWQEVASERKVNRKKLKSKAKKVMAASKLRDVIRAARNKKKEGDMDGSSVRFGVANSTPARLSKSARKRASLLVTPGRKSRSSVSKTPQAVI